MSSNEKYVFPTVICHQSITCNLIISMPTKSGFRILNHYRSDPHTNSMAFILSWKMRNPLTKGLHNHFTGVLWCRIWWLYTYCELHKIRKKLASVSSSVKRGYFPHPWKMFFPCFPQMTDMKKKGKHDFFRI